MIKTTLLSIVLAFIFLQANSQELYMPRDIKAAYKKGTRSPDGRPGKSYWQNSGRYDISISVAPPSPDVKGVEHITKKNKRPKTHNKKNKKQNKKKQHPKTTRYSSTSADYLTDGIQ